MKYKSLVINDPAELMFGIAPKPVRTPRGLLIGGGQVYAELNFIFLSVFLYFNLFLYISMYFNLFPSISTYFNLFPSISSP